MMDVKNWLGWTAAIAALYYAVLRGANALIVAVRGYRFQSIDTTNGTISFYLYFVINNPLLVGLTLKGLSGDIYVQGVKCGVVNMKYDYFISGRHSHSVPVLVTVDASKLTEAAILNIQSGNVKTLTIAFDGGLNIGSEQVYIPVQKTLDWEDLTA